MMSRKDKREWKEMWGNAALTENELFNKVILILDQQHRAIEYNDLYQQLFPNADGKILHNTFRRIIIQLTDENILLTEEGNRCRLTGKGIKLCKIHLKPLRKYPYSVFRIYNIIDSIFTKYLPIIISIIALIISFLAYSHRK